MVWRVREEHARWFIGASDRDLELASSRATAIASITGEALVVAQDSVHVLIARQDPRLHERTPVHGVLSTQERVRGIRIFVRPRRERVVRHAAVPPLTRHHDADTNSSEHGV